MEGGLFHLRNFDMVRVNTETVRGKIITKLNTLFNHSLINAIKMFTNTVTKYKTLQQILHLLKYFLSAHHKSLQVKHSLTLNLLNSLNGIICLPILELCITILGISRSKLVSQQCIEPGQTAEMYRLAWLYNGGKG